jgi:hypothetical protein
LDGAESFCTGAREDPAFPDVCGPFGTEEMDPAMSFLHVPLIGGDLENVSGLQNNG